MTCAIRWPRPVLPAALALILATTAAPAAELVSPWQESIGARARLVAGQAGGAPFAGVEIVLEDGWKTYWRVPGDAGVPPVFDWTQSTNLAAADVLYPAPRRFRDTAGDTIGYTGRVMFPVRLAARDGAAPVGLKLRLDYAICSDLCVPVRADLALVVPPAAALPAGPASDATIDAGLAQVPARVESSEVAPRVTAVELIEAGGRPGLRVAVRHSPPAQAADLFAEGPPDWYLAPPAAQGAEAAAGAGEIVYHVAFGTARPATPVAGARLRFTIRDGGRAFEQEWRLP